MGSIYPEIFVIHHGQTEWNAAGRHQGRLDSPLTGKGRRQAVAMAGMLRRAVACAARPMAGAG
ncbi:phosphoglycerate mutase family protein [Aliiroseovarius sp. S253]|uniref:phosphoglycerate mutase family protein n=1 Tax=Aliiroseovarius sp. S253 TaxID=3415133 RepID=UPI003C7BC771